MVRGADHLSGVVQAPASAGDTALLPYSFTESRSPSPYAESAGSAGEPSHLQDLRAIGLQPESNPLNRKDISAIQPYYKLSSDSFPRKNS